MTTPADAVIAAIVEVHEAAVRFVELHPKRATNRLRKAVAAYKEIAEDGPTGIATCRRCHYPIEQRYSRWLHVPGLRRGCRAASWDRLDDTWDDSLDRKWVATPEEVE